MITASREQGIRADFLESGQKLLDEQAAIGNGSRDWVQIIESLAIRQRSGRMVDRLAGDVR